MTYVLENSSEAQRLEQQSELSAYQLASELRDCTVLAGQRVLDAGCGSGVAARYLAKRSPGARIDACDLSVSRLNEARLLAAECGLDRIRFFESDLEKILAPESTYHLIFCRYVYEHVADPRKVSRELYRVTRSKGRLCVVDFDGLLLNIFPMSRKLRNWMERIATLSVPDLHVGRKIPFFLQEAGFQKVDWGVEAHAFRGDDLIAERELTHERLEFARPLLTRLLGSQRRAVEFQGLYCKEMTRPGSTLFYNKFIVTAWK